MMEGFSVANAHALTLPAESGEWSLPSRRKVGVIGLILTESALFTIFVVAYLFYIGKSATGPYPNQVLDLPILATICLLSSSFTVVLAERAFRQGNSRGFQLWWLITILLAVVFLGATALEWHKLIFRDHLTISTNLFGTTFYSLVGLHASHVIVGLILLVLVFILSLRGYVTRAHAEHVEMLSWYWHFVDGIWVIVFTVVYIIGR
jgi:cytochrome c oxidase subunit 3/cytochrome o ubiquinol oxidase subunit 3